MTLAEIALSTPAVDNVTIPCYGLPSEPKHG